MLLTSCSLLKPKTIEPKEVRVWWGSKEQIKTFLDSPQAQANRWVCEAIGE